MSTPTVRKVKIRKVAAEPAEAKPIEDWGPFLIETGLLGYINTHVMHPLGLAVVMKDDGSGIKHVLDCRHNPVITLSQEDCVEARRKLEDYLNKVGRDTTRRRKELLGFVTQH